MAETAAVECCGVSVRLGGATVLSEVDLVVPRGDYMAIIGPNGGGKSTLLKVILGLVTPDAGTVQVLGETTTRARGRIGYVPQFVGFDLDFPIRVLDVVLMGCMGRRGLVLPLRAPDRDKALAALAQVGLADVAGRPVAALSGGERERVLIARALAVEPEILLLDEPTASADVHAAFAFYDLLAELAERMTVLLVSHDVGTVSRNVRTIACLNRKLVVHPAAELTADILEETYGCPLDLVAHGAPHRVLGAHDHSHAHGHSHGGGGGGSR